MRTDLCKLLSIAATVFLILGVFACSDAGEGSQSLPDGDTDTDSVTPDGDIPADGDATENEAEPDVQPPVDGDGESEPEEDAPGCVAADALGAGDHTIELEFDGISRSYIAHIPEGYQKGAFTPLVLNIHGYEMEAWQEQLFTEMDDLSDAEGFLLIYPEGYKNSWNAGIACCGDAVAENVDDVGFLRAVVADASARWCVDAARTYVTGMSNGGYMTYRLACEAGDLFAAFAPVAGALGYVGCTPARPVPIMAYHGTEDMLVAYADDVASFEAWADMNGCSGEPVRTEHGEGSYCEVYAACADGVELGLCTLDPMGHCWPGAGEALCTLSGMGPYNGDIDANRHMWDFFSRYTLERGE